MLFVGAGKGRKGWGKSNAVDLVLWCCQLVSGCHGLQWPSGLSKVSEAQVLLWK